MKSFYEHLRSRLEFGEQIEDTRRPVFRSSSIFPVIKNNSYSTNILFLGYWLLKRNIPEISSLITLRNKDGTILKRNYFSIKDTKAYSIELDSMLNNTILSNKSEFLGSIETEFFSTRDLVFPFPATVLNYYNDEFNTCVHTIQRIYNDFEDLNDNEKFRVPETGFDIYSDNDLSAFLAVVNGPVTNENAIINYVITNNVSQKFSGNFELGNVKPYETIFLKFEEHIPNLTEFLKGKSGSISVEHNFEGFFPRFLVGNTQRSFPCCSFTHSYYDCTSCAKPSDYWDRISEDYHDCSVYIPLFVDNNYYTDLVFYPNFSPSNFDLQINIYNKDGNLLQEFPNFKKINSADSKLLKINFNNLVKDLNIDTQDIHTAHIIANSVERRIPARIKFGLNVGIMGKKAKLPCNICFNLHPGNPQAENKPGSFHWCPLINKGNSIVSIANFSPLKNNSRSAEIILNFYRGQDSKSIAKKIDIPPNSEFRFDLEKNPDVISFLQKSNGWLTIKANNPNIQGFYFNFHSSGSVGGDHLF